MPITFECEKCRRRYQVGEELAGKRGRCKQCGESFTVPFPPSDDPYALDDEEWTSRRPDAEPVPGPVVTKKKKAKKMSGLFAISALPPVGYHIYRGVAVAILVASLFVAGVPKLILALAGMFLCVGPIVASGFSYRFGIAFRDGPIAGLLYIFFFPYRIHYRLTHQELFRTHRAPSLTRHDFMTLVFGLLFLPVLVVAAQEIDKMPKNRPPAVDWGHFALKGAGPKKADGPAVERQPRPEMPNLRELARKGKPARPDEPRAVEPKAVEPKAAEPKAAEPAPDVPKPADPPAPRPEAAERPQPAQLSTGGPAAAGPNRPARGFRRPPMIGPPGKGSAPAFGPDETVTITINGVGDPASSKRLNDAITEIMKQAGKGWSLSASTSGGKATFTVAPVTDPKAFADKINFGKVTRVDGRAIEVDAGP